MSRILGRKRPQHNTVETKKTGIRPGVKYQRKGEKKLEIRGRFSNEVREKEKNSRGGFHGGVLEKRDRGGAKTKAEEGEDN